jgi:hypothetical protein
LLSVAGPRMSIKQFEPCAECWERRRSGSSSTLRPGSSCSKRTGAKGVIDEETEAKLLVHLRQPANDVFVIAQDTWLRPDEVFRMRVENINWTTRAYFNASGKTKRSRRL